MNIRKRKKCGGKKKKKKKVGGGERKTAIEREKKNPKEPDKKILFYLNFVVFLEEMYWFVHVHYI